MNDGTVSIIGAGPGAADLLTVRARRRIDEADVVLHDSLVGDDVVASLPSTAAVVHVGKRPDGRRTSQEEINHRMVREARDGKRVVRLKGGDPCTFGRGGEEAEFLARHDVPFEIVPGVTSALAAPAVAGIPATHREHASSLTVVTGHEDPTKEESALDWDALASTVSAGGTLVVLMGVRRLPDNVGALVEHGVAPETPAAMVERATLPDQQTVTGRLDTIVRAAREAEVSPPAVTVVGDVVRVRDTVEAALGADAVDGGADAGVGAAGWEPPLEGEVNQL